MDEASNESDQASNVVFEASNEPNQAGYDLDPMPDAADAAGDLADNARPNWIISCEA
jgi:hypothetical protein